jgi:hypothetical protein
VAEAGVNPVKPFRSILFEHPVDEGQREDPSMFRDLNLDQVFAAVASGRGEYDLTPFFAAPLREVRAVEYRHQVQQDLADDALSKAGRSAWICTSRCSAPPGFRPRFTVPYS